MQLDVDNHTNTITAIGFTGDQNKNSMTGYVFLQIDPFDGEILNRNAEQFSPELLSSISSKTDKSEKYIPVYKPMQIIPRADGGALLVSEYFQKQQRITTLLITILITVIALLPGKLIITNTMMYFL